jgi:hypothetical protein
MSPLRLLALMTALLAVSGILAAADVPEAGGKIPCLVVLAKSAEEHGGTWASSFHASRTTDLTLAVVLPKTLEGEHEVELKIFTPRDNLYQSIRVPMAAPGKTPENRTVASYPMAIKQLRLAQEDYKGKPYYKAEISFPVGGTLITTNSLYGQWRIEAYLDGEKKPCGPPTYLQIEE